MVKKYSRLLKQRSNFILGLAVALLVGGAASAAVFASIPDSGGTIHGCYKNSTGTLRAIDSTASCASGETALNWSQNGTGAQVLKDANGQVLGDLISDNLGNNSLEAYNHTIGRVILFSYDSSTQAYDRFGIQLSPNFQSSDCSGQAYVSVDPSSPQKTGTFWWINSSGAMVNAIVGNSTSTTSITINSFLPGDGSACQTVSSTSDTDFPLTSVSLPFTTPVATPFMF